MNGEKEDLAEWDAAYVLGALSPQDRLAYEDYLAANPKRAAALTEFAGLPGLLNLLSPEEALALDATTGDDVGEERVLDLMPSLARAAERRQRRSRRNVMVMVTATAAAFLAVGVIVTASVVGRTPDSSTTPTLQAMAPGGRPGISAQLAVTEKKWGTRLDWKCEYTKDWSKNVGSYDLVVTTVDGEKAVVGSWRPAGDEASGLSAATEIPASKIRSVYIRETGTDAPLAVKTLR
jgi:hypothetical protein